MTLVHPTAIVDPWAKLGEDVEVGPYAVIGENVELAPGVAVGSHVTVMGRTTIGSRTRISPFAVIGGEPQIVGASGENTALVIGEDNLIREFSSIHVGSPNGGGCTRIGNGKFILNNVHIAHDCRIGDRRVLASFSALAGHVVLEDHVVFGAMTGVHQFVRIGESAFTAANSMVSKDAVPFSKVAGDRARFVGLNTVADHRARSAAHRGALGSRAGRARGDDGRARARFAPSRPRRRDRRNRSGDREEAAPAHAARRGSLAAGRKSCCSTAWASSSPSSRAVRCSSALARRTPATRPRSSRRSARGFAWRTPTTSLAR